MFTPTTPFEKDYIDFKQEVKQTLKETCNTVTSLDKTVAVLNEKVSSYVDKKVAKSENKYKYITIILAGVTTFATIWSVFK